VIHQIIFLTNGSVPNACGHRLLIFAHNSEKEEFLAGIAGGHFPREQFNGQPFRVIAAPNVVADERNWRRLAELK